MEPLNTEFVSQRRRQPLRRSISIGNISSNDLSNEANTSLFDMTMKSLPNTSLDESNGLSELAAQIQKLKEELQIAHYEIEKLNMENCKLKMDLDKSQKAIDTYKRLGIHNTPLTGKNKAKTHKNSSHKSNCDRTILFSTPQTNQHTKEHSLPNPPAAIEPSDSGRNHRTNSEFQSHSESGKSTTTSNSTPRLEAVNKRIKKRKLCILSNRTNNGPLKIVEQSFFPYFDLCRYSLPNSNIQQLVSKMKPKILDFDMNDYCIILLGETDFKNNNNYIELVRYIRSCISGLNHTNIIICAATYILGSPIYNYKVELFNSLLYMELQNNKCTYFFDTNAYLNFEMFSNYTGKVNNQGLRKVYERLIDNIKIDFENFPMNTETDICVEKPSMDAISLSHNLNTENASNFFRI